MSATSGKIYGNVGKRGGSRSGAGGSSVQYGSAYDAGVDKKFEGYSDLKGAATRKQSRITAKDQARANDELEENIIHNLQSQIAIMETEIKLLKDQEVDQKNKASGYETLLRDGIPLNEHFLALKNKFNNEQSDLKKAIMLQENEIKQDEEKNQASEHRIHILKGEYQEISRKFNIYKDEKQDKIKNLESTLYNQTHTKAMLAAEKDIKSKLLSKIRGENAVSDRAIKQNKLAQNKKDEKNKKLRQERAELKEKLDEVNAQIIEKSLTFDRETRRFNDKGLLQRHVRETMALKQENSLCNIDINIADSRRTDLEAQQKMCEVQLQEILTESRKITKENTELEYKIQGRGVTEADQKAKLFEAERKMAQELQHNLQIMQEDAEIMGEQLKKEEEKCKDMLDLKITAEQTFKDFTEPDAEEMANRRRANREELIQAKIQLSKLNKKRDLMTKENAELEETNAKTKKANDEYEEANQKSREAIKDLIQRIDVATVLKEVDLEEMKLLHKNNTALNSAFSRLLTKWDQIHKEEYKELIN